MAFIRSSLSFVACVICASSTVVSRRVLRVFRPMAVERIDRWRDSLYRIGGKGMLFFSGIRLECEGTPPERPYILVCNHISIFDIFALGAALGCKFVANDDIGISPLFGAIARDFEPIFIDRRRVRDAARVNAAIRKALDANAGIVIFAEAGISPEGDVREFRTPLFQPAAEMGLPVYTAALGYETPLGGPTAHECVVWRDPDSLVRHFLNVSGLGGCTARIVFGEEPITADDRRKLADETHQAVWKLFQPLRAIQTREDADGNDAQPEISNSFKRN